MRTKVVQPPIADSVLDELTTVFREWLRIPGRRERTFTLGSFDRDYIRKTPIMMVTDAGNRVAAFANIIPSFHAGEATIDLMRRRADVPNGVMDYLFIQLFLYSKEQGFNRFSLGLSPMSGFGELEAASPEERALHAVAQRLNFVFSYRGIKAYKAKFASFWEPRYVYYSHLLGLPKLAYALGRISTIKE
jgi:phosphatidylglycerol lysyltransferase